MEIINQTEEEIRKATQRKMTLEDTLEQVCWPVQMRTEMHYRLTFCRVWWDAFGLGVGFCM